MTAARAAAAGSPTPCRSCAAAAEQVPGDVLADRGDGHVGKHDQMEVINRDPPLRQRRADGSASSTAHGSPLAAPKHSEDQGVTVPPSFRRAGPGCPVKIEKP